MEYLNFSSFPILSTFTVLFLIVALKIWKTSKYTDSSHQKLPPGPPKLPIIGSMHHLFGDMPHRRMYDLAKKYGPIMHLQLGGVTNIVISSPEAAELVMKTHDLNFADRPSILGADILFDNGSDIAFAPYGNYWRQMRKMCSCELLSAKRVESFRPVREEEFSELIVGIYNGAGSPVNMTNMMRSSAYKIISRAAFGEVWNGKDVFVSLVNKALQLVVGFSLADLYPSLKFLHRISWVKFRATRVRRELDKISEDIINRHRRKSSHAQTAMNCRKDLVDVLLDVQKQENLGFHLSSNSIKAVIIDMFAAGTETTSTTLEWAMSELMRNPKAIAKAQEEVRRVFSQNGKIEETRLDELNYTRAVIKETLRLHPPLPFLLPRECREKCEINNYDIPAKSRIIVNAWAIGRDTNYWVEAEKFIPERFLDASIDYNGTKFGFIPFGAGRRICPGLSFGTISTEYALSQLLYYFDWKLPTPEDLDMAETFSLVLQKKNDLMLIPTPYLPLNAE